jgi:ActR/RegA family two-component response regulator
VGEKEKILVLDDDPEWLRRIEKLLGAEYELTLTQDNQEAISKVKSINFALVILDMRLNAGVSGIEILIKMRKSVPDLRAIILTAYDKSALAVASLQAGALDYITKGPNLSFRLKEVIKKHKRTDLVKVFLSYVRADVKRVSNLYSKLTAQGFLPWIDIYDVKAGRWEPQILKAIRNSDFFIACLSPSSISKTGFIKREFKFALEKQDEFDEDKGYIIPIRLVDCPIPESLREFETVDLWTYLKNMDSLN